MYLIVYLEVLLCFSLWGVFHVVIFNLILFLLLFSHTRAMISDPGIVPLPRTQLDFSELRSVNRLNRRSDSDSDISKGSYVVILNYIPTYVLETF